MLFCPKCGALLLPKKSGSKKVMACSCGFSTKDIKDAKIKDEVISKERAVEVIDKEIEVLPLMNVECPKCKHGKAYYWEIQTRASDEPATKFLKCENCKHIWRDYK